MMKSTMARGDVLTESCERKRFLKSSANASSILTDHLSLFTCLSCRSPMKDEGRSPELGAVSSVVEHYLDTVGVRGSKPLPRTIFSPSQQVVCGFSRKRRRLDCNTSLFVGDLTAVSLDILF